MEEDLNGGQPQWKTTSMEDNFEGRTSRPQWKPYRKQMTLASQFCTELGPAQPQLVFLISYLINTICVFMEYKFK